jgi:hypothetical protein
MLLPIVRYMVPCEEMILRDKTVSLSRLMLNVRSRRASARAVFQRQICVFVALTEVRGNAEISLRIIHADSGETHFSIKPKIVSFANDPLHVYGLPFRLRNCLFPSRGLYWIQFWFNDACLSQQDLMVR